MENTNISEKILYEFSQGKQIKLSNFNYTQKGSIASYNSSVKYSFRITEDTFVDDLVITPYDKQGSLYGISNNPRDRFTVMINNNGTGQNWMEAPVDVMHFSPHRERNVFPEILTRDTTLTITIYHEPTVDLANFDEMISFPITFEVTLKGAKLKEVKK